MRLSEKEAADLKAAVQRSEEEAEKARREKDAALEAAVEVGKQLRASDEKLSAARAAAEKAKSILAEERTTLLQDRAAAEKKANEAEVARLAVGADVERLKKEMAEQAQKHQAQMEQFASLGSRLQALQQNQFVVASRTMGEKKQRRVEVETLEREVARLQEKLELAEKDRKRLAALVKELRRKAAQKHPDDGVSWMPDKPQAAFARHLDALPPLRAQMRALSKKLEEHRGLEREQAIIVRCVKYFDALANLCERLQQNQTIEWYGDLAAAVKEALPGAQKIASKVGKVHSLPELNSKNGRRPDELPGWVT
jgi:chromosome segregation ATPase